MTDLKGGPLKPILTTRNICRLCSVKLPEENLLVLPATPPANAFVRDPDCEQLTFPLEVVGCTNCEHVQLRHVLAEDVRLGRIETHPVSAKPYPYRLLALARAMTDRFQLSSGDVIVSLGNDAPLKAFPDGIRGVAVEAHGLLTPSVGRALRQRHGEASLLIADTPTFAQADDLAAVLTGVKELIHPSGAFVFEVPYIGAILERGRFDLIDHLHLSYHAVRPLVRFLRDNGFVLRDVQRIDGGLPTIRCHVELDHGQPPSDEVVALLDAEVSALGHYSLADPRAWQPMKAKLDRCREQVREIIQNTDVKIIGFGAESTTILHALEIARGNADMGQLGIDYIVDGASDHHGTLTPGKHIPVAAPLWLYEEMEPCTILVLDWGDPNLIVEGHRELMDRGHKFVVPHPVFEVYP